MIPKSDDQRAEDSAQKSALAKYLRYSNLGVLFFAAVGLFTWGGIWLDGRLETGVELDGGDIYATGVQALIFGFADNEEGPAGG